MLRTKLSEKYLSWILITIGCLLTSAGYVFFILPLNLFEGGVIGIGIIVKQLTGLPIVGMTSLAVTIIVFMIGIKILGKSFGAKSIYATAVLSISMDFGTWIGFPKVTEDIILAAFYGGAFTGIGMGLVYYSGASTGGADGIAQIFRKLKQIPIGRTLITIDFFVLGTAALFFAGLENIMYSFLFIFIQIKAVDLVLNGFQANQRIIIYTSAQEVIKEAIIFKLQRGLSVYKAKGAYSGVEKDTLITVIPKKHVPEIRRLIAEADPDAFVIIQDVNQVYGKGFEPLPKLK
ncbi:MAG: YitT family protein [Candidatus Delongbacteria bacterium]|nr:YitT family protein [Candidatus Delongbacteria bacterium]MBN2833664.1 YitT family protein [Candidatus Delongbacteria bacterium]